MLAERDRGATRDSAYPAMRDSAYPAMRDSAYPDCVVAVTPDAQAGLGPEEIRALRVLADAGLLPTVPAAPVPAGQALAAGQAPVTPVSPVNRRAGTAARGAGARPAAARGSYRKNSSHPQLKPHSPRPALRRDRQDRAESKRIG